VPGAEAKWPETVRRAEAWLAEKCLVISNTSLSPTASASPATTNHLSLITNHSATPLDPCQLATAIIARYGKDRTFSVPILTMCALAGRFGSGQDAWRKVIQLPFELAALPQKFFATLRLPVVSYALPALIAIGQVRHHHRPTRNPVLRLLRDRARAKTLRVLERIQPPNGGFLEATPLTSFVTMSLAGSGNAEHPVARRGLEFLQHSVRADGSWPIDTNLATLAINALGPSIHDVMSDAERARLLDWLLAQQYRTVHPYTGAAPGGWAWTDLPGGVPDADDTAGALLALKNLSLAPGFSRGDATADGKNCLNSFFSGDDGHTRLKPGANEKEPQPLDPRVRAAAIAGVKWLLDLQNRDGGIPTFCRGWTNLPFDRSSPDITAHALRAWLAWRDELPADIKPRLHRALLGAWKFLGEPNPAVFGWAPLWFGNQNSRQEENRTYGTSRVMMSMADLRECYQRNPEALGIALVERLERTVMGAFCWAKWWQGLAYLVLSRTVDGGWECGEGPDERRYVAGENVACSVEETALALEAVVRCSHLLNEDALCEITASGQVGAQALTVASTLPPVLAERLSTGTEWLLRRVEDGTWTQPAPIGFYFAKLWYYERLYPMVFTIAALEAVARLPDAEPPK
jgi:squalene-hopene/tetraprenyl-beta-curcumene cyclase